MKTINKTDVNWQLRSRRMSKMKYLPCKQAGFRNGIHDDVEHKDEDGFKGEKFTLPAC